MRTSDSFKKKMSAALAVIVAAGCVPAITNGNVDPFNTYLEVSAASHNVVSYGFYAEITDPDAENPELTKSYVRIEMDSGNNKVNYSGYPVTASTVIGVGVPSDVIVGSVTYEGTGSTSYPSSVQPPIEAGTYRASALVNAVTIYTDFEIVSTDVEVNDAMLAINPSEFVYDGTTKKPTVSVWDGKRYLTEGVDYDITSSSVTEATAVSTGLGYPVTVVGKGDYTGTVTEYWTIAKAAAAVVSAPKPVDSKYDGSAHALVEPGTVTGGKMVYSLDGVLYSESVPTAVDAKEYTVYYKAQGDENHSDSTVGTVKATITGSSSSSGNINYVPTPRTVKYNGKAQALVEVKSNPGVTTYYAVTTDPDYVPSASEFTESIPVGIEPDVYYVWYMNIDSKTFEHSPKIECVEALIYGDSYSDYHTVSFDTGDSTYIPSQKVVDGGKATEPSDPVRAGATFVGWFYNGKLYDFSKPVYRNIVLTAEWVPYGNPTGTYTVSFDSNGGSYVSSQSVKYGNYAYRPTNPTRTGYTFSYWTLNGYEYNFNTPITSNTTLRAVWVPNSNPSTYHTVTFDSNGGSYVSSQNVAHGNYAYRPTNPTRYGYTFSHWSYNGSQYNFNTPVTSNITVHAVWNYNYGYNTYYDDYYYRYGYGINPYYYYGYGYDYYYYPSNASGLINPVVTYTYAPNTAPRTNNTSKPAYDTTITEKGDIAKLVLKGDTAYLSWQADKKAVSYTVYKKTATGLVSFGTVKNPRVTIKRLTNDCEYNIVVRANYSDGTYSKASVADFTFITDYNPVVEIEELSDGVRLSWDKKDYAEEYKVCRLKNGKLVQMVVTKKTSVVVNGEEAKDYDYVVKAYMNGGWTRVGKRDIVRL